MKSVAARPFHVETVVKPSDGPKSWNTSIVTIIDGSGAPIGSYERNYAAYADETFEPFEIEGEWFALYSRDYTCTRVMKLPACIDIGGEEPRSDGFCPVEFFVPRYREVHLEFGNGRTGSAWWFERSADDPVDAAGQRGTTIFRGAWKSLDLGFVAGCLWGDDVSWKLQAIDLSKAAEGCIVRKDLYGHVELPRGMSLSDAVRFEKFKDGRLWVRLTRDETRDMRTGELIDPYDQ